MKLVTLLIWYKDIDGGMYRVIIWIEFTLEEKLVMIVDQSKSIVGESSKGQLV